jgi:hypothetical protein
MAPWRAKDSGIYRVFGVAPGGRVIGIGLICPGTREPFSPKAV